LHEYSLLEGVIHTILVELKKPGTPPGEAVKEVTLNLGALEIHSEAATHLAFEVLTRGTILENSRLRLIIQPATLACPQCGQKGPLPEDQLDPHNPSLLAACPRCGTVSPVQGGRGVGPIELVFGD
jgi:Zn finger protein HypA/HybF involved in hydrogenase expression